MQVIEPFLAASNIQKMVYRKENIISCEWNQVNTSTGRFSASNPNLQTLPKLKANVLADSFTGDVSSVEDENSMKEKFSIRGAFIASKGYRLLSADFACMVS